MLHTRPILGVRLIELISYTFCWCLSSWMLYIKQCLFYMSQSGAYRKPAARTHQPDTLSLGLLPKSNAFYQRPKGVQTTRYCGFTGNYFSRSKIKGVFDNIPILSFYTKRKKRLSLFIQRLGKFSFYVLSPF